MTLPAALQEIVDEFSAAPATLRLPLLLEYASKLPPLPEGMEGQLERVHECQTPLFLRVELNGEAVSLYFEAPPEAPTTRGFASVIWHGLNGCSASEVLEVPGDFYSQMGLAELISPLRLRGMGSIVARIKKQVRAARGE